MGLCFQRNSSPPRDFSAQRKRTEDLCKTSHPPQRRPGKAPQILKIEGFGFLPKAATLLLQGLYCS
jgi:hypothetical protein